MSELRQHIQDELKKGRIEALKSCTYEQICDLLDSQEKQMNDLERQLEEAREEVEYALNFFNKNKQFGVVGILKEIKNKLKEKGE